MSNIVRFDPFTSSLNDLFEGLLVRPIRFDVDGGRELTMKVDVAQDDKTYTVTADMPGVKKDDIHVEIDGNLVSISAEVKKESEDKEGEKVLRRECYYGAMQRSFTLPTDVEGGKVEAKYVNGVLEVTLPKKAGGTTKKIEVR